MDRAEVDSLIEQLRQGRRVRVPFDVTLWPDAQATRSVLGPGVGGGFELATEFREFWAGHGWSVEQTETEARTEAQVREALASCKLTDCELLAP